MLAKIRLKWKRTVSTGSLTRKLTVTNDGETIVVDLPIEVEEYFIDVKASKTFSFQTEVKDDEGLVVSSTFFTFTLGDLIAPQPDTELGFEIVSIVDDSVPVLGNVPSFPPSR
jgi:hypothetical protein